MGAPATEKKTIRARITLIAEVATITAAIIGGLGFLVSDVAPKILALDIPLLYVHRPSLTNSNEVAGETNALSLKQPQLALLSTALNISPNDVTLHASPSESQREKVPVGFTNGQGASVYETTNSQLRKLTADATIDSYKETSKYDAGSSLAPNGQLVLPLPSKGSDTLGRVFTKKPPVSRHYLFTIYNSTGYEISYYLQSLGQWTIKHSLSPNQYEDIDRQSPNLRVLFDASPNDSYHQIYRDLVNGTGISTEVISSENWNVASRHEFQIGSEGEFRLCDCK